MTSVAYHAKVEERYQANALIQPCNHHETCIGDSYKAAHPPTIFPVTRERWAQIGITTQFLIVVRTLGEVFRLKHVQGTNAHVTSLENGWGSKAT